jgi:hypothetical protein
VLLALARGIAPVRGVLLDEGEEPADGLLVVVVLLAFEDDLCRQRVSMAGNDADWMTDRQTFLPLKMNWSLRSSGKYSSVKNFLPRSSLSCAASLCCCGMRSLMLS